MGLTSKRIESLAKNLELEILILNVLLSLDWFAFTSLITKCAPNAMLDVIVLSINIHVLIICFTDKLYKISF